MKTLIFLLFPMLLLAQTRGIVRDELTGKGIPYVNIWVQNENIGVTSDENGNYIISTTNADKIIVFSAAGYETKKVKLPETRKLSLTPVAALPGHSIVARLETQTQTIGDYKKSQVKLTYGSHGLPWMMARKFRPEHAAKTPYLKEVTLMTDSNNDSMMFHVRIMDIGKDGNPGADLTDKVIRVYAMDGKKDTAVDLSPYHLKCPENGFFVVIEWIVIPQNIKFKKLKRPGMKDYDPAIGVIPTENNSTWGYMLGKWAEFPKSGLTGVKAFKDKYIELAMRLTLTN